MIWTGSQGDLMRFHSFSIAWDHCIIALVGNWWILMDRMDFPPKKDARRNAED